MSARIVEYQFHGPYGEISRAAFDMSAVKYLEARGEEGCGIGIEGLGQSVAVVRIPYATVLADWKAYRASVDSPEAQGQMFPALPPPVIIPYEPLRDYGPYCSTATYPYEPPATTDIGDIKL